MRFNEIDLFGVYVAPISLMMIGAWLILIPLRRLADGFGLLQQVWHPALFWFAVYMMSLSAIVLIAARSVTIMSAGKPRSEHVIAEVDHSYATPPPTGGDNAKLPIRAVSVVITLGAVLLAALLTWATWQVYMTAPWTRDGTVRVYVVGMAPEVAGRIVELPVADNQLVKKGDPLMVIDPTNYAIAVRHSEAAVEQAKAVAQNAEAQSERRQKLTNLSISTEVKQIFATTALSADAAYQQAVASRDQARVNLERTRI